MEQRVQMRGHCQHCGRIQAAMPGGIAKHGYTVEFGWFQGVCSGAGELPLEVSRVLLDEMVSKLREWADSADDQALKLEQREIDPEGKWVSYSELGLRKRKLKPYAEMEEWEKRECRRLTVGELQFKARQMRSHADVLLGLAEKVHGQPLQEAVRPVGPDPIRKGERRQENGRQYEADYAERGRVYYYFQGESGRRRGWMGTQAWRRLEKVG